MLQSNKGVSKLEYINNPSYINDDLSTAIAIGNFDGFHKGHQALIKKLNEIKSDKGIKSLVFSFNPRPYEVFNNVKGKSILSLPERMELGESLGIDTLVEYPFSLEFSYMSGEDFIKNVLIEQFGCKHIIIGEDFAFGKNRMWDAARISEIGAELGISVTIAPHELNECKKISSSIIRKLLENGEIKEVNELLGYDYFVNGTVGHGDKRGHGLGFPTMNIEPGTLKILPPNGVYITETHLQDGSHYPSITNIGNNITFGYVATRVETHIYGFSGCIYEESAKVVFKERVRGEIKFSGVDELVRQIELDLDRMKGYFGI